MFGRQGSMLAMVLWIGVLSGFPQVLIGSLLALWLKSEGFSKTNITALGAVAFFYTLNWLLAPFLDRFTLLSGSRRRAWMMLCLLMIALCCFALSGLDPKAQLAWLVAAVLLIAFFSALMDVVIDAFRIELCPPNRPDWLALGAAAAVMGWYSGFNLGGALGLYLYEYFARAGGAAMAWQKTYGALGWLVVAMMAGLALHMLFVREQDGGVNDGADGAVDGGAAKHWWQEVMVAPFRAFVTMHGARWMLVIVLFVVLFKLGEAFLGRTAILFYREIGFSEAQIAQYAKVTGWAVMMVFALISGWVTQRLGVWRGLMIGGIAMAATNLLFAWLAQRGPDQQLLMAAVALDQFTTALANVAFVTYISSLCDRRYTASQYALLSSLGNFSRIVLASSSGLILERYLNNNWSVFFVLTTLMALPGLALLWLLGGHHASRRSSA